MSGPAVPPTSSVEAGSAESVWEADDTEPVLDTTVASILRDAARRSPDTIALVAGAAAADPDLDPAGVGPTPSSSPTPSVPRRHWRRASSPASVWP